MLFLFFFFNDTATTEIYTLSLHDALPIYRAEVRPAAVKDVPVHPFDGLPGPLVAGLPLLVEAETRPLRSEEHTSELQSQSNLVCRLLLEKKKNDHYHCERDFVVDYVLASY